MHFEISNLGNVDKKRNIQEETEEQKELLRKVGNKKCEDYGHIAYESP